MKTLSISSLGLPLVNALSASGMGTDTDVGLIVADTASESGLESRRK